MKFITLTDGILPTPCVATIGFFDGVHIGHRFLIGQVKHHAAERRLASLLVTFRTHPRQVMQSSYRPALLSTYKEKCGLLASTGADYCLTLDFTPELAQLSAREFMEKILKRILSVQVLVVGYDHHFGHGKTDGFPQYVQYGRETGIEVIQAEPLPLNGINVSSSVVRAFLSEGEVSMAARCLSHPYTLTGQVVNGFHIGHELGFPTANIQPDSPQKLIPKNGVYAVKVTEENHTGQKTWAGMLNIGTRPTIGNGEEQSIEVHLLDFDGNLYGQALTLSFIRRLRDERKFRNKGELTKQLHADEEQVRNILSNDSI